MPKATLLSSYANKPRNFSLVIGKSVLQFKAGVPKEVTPSIAAKLAQKMEDERDVKGRKTGKKRCMFDIQDMPDVKENTEPVRKPRASKKKSEVGESRQTVKGQRRLA